MIHDFVEIPTCSTPRDTCCADHSRLVQLQVGIGICTKSTAEFGKRGELFWVELDFVLANVIMALIADFMLVWLPAPTVSFRYRLNAHHCCCLHDQEARSLFEHRLTDR